MSSPNFSISICPICGGGLCGIRVCGVPAGTSESTADASDRDGLHGIVVCDECEAIWLEPDVSTAHMYADAEHPQCPICGADLWGPNSRWATWDDVESLGWELTVDHRLDACSSPEHQEGGANGVLPEHDD